MDSLLEHASERGELAVASEERCFTDFARIALLKREPSLRELDRIWTKLRAWVRRALQRRGMWNRRPVYLGILGDGAWVTPETADGKGAPRGMTRDSLDELVQEVYVEIFVKRARHLRRYIRQGRAIEALVRRAVDQAIHDRQKARDPLGQRLYQWLRSAVHKGLESGEIRLRDGGSRNEVCAAKIEASTVLYFGPDGSEAEVETTWQDLELHARRWNDELFVDWLTAKGQDSELVVGRLALLLMGLAQSGVTQVRFQVLVEALTRDTRSRLAVLFSQWQPMSRAWSTGDGSDVAKAWDDPRRISEAQDRFQSLAGCVEQRIDGVDGQRRTREQMRRLWRLLGVWARAMATGPGSSDDHRLADLFKGDGFPSDRELGRLLDLRHDRVKDLMTRLKVEIGSCLESTRPSSMTAVGAVGAVDASEALVSTEDLGKHLLAQTLEAAASLGDSAVSGEVAESAEVAVGALCVLDPTGPDIEWLVLGSEEEHRLLVPVDSEPWLGSKDAAVPGEPGLTARLGLGFWAPAGELDVNVVGTVPAAGLEALRRRRFRVLDGLVEAEDQAWEVDVDPDYGLWMGDLERARTRLSERLGGMLDGMPGSAREATGTVEPERLAPELVQPESAVLEPVGAEPTQDAIEPLAPVRSISEYQTVRAGKMRPWALAASIVAAVSFGVIGGRVFEQSQVDPRFSEAQEARRQLEQQNRELEERMAAQASRSEQRLKDLKDQAERDRVRDRESYDSRLSTVEQRYEARLSELSGAELVTGWVYVPPGTQRGAHRVTLSGESRSIVIQVPAQEGDRILLMRARDRQTIYEIVVEGVQPGDDVGLRVPGSLLPPGSYRVEVIRAQDTVTRYGFTVVEETQEEDLWP